MLEKLENGIVIDHSRDSLFSEQGMKLLKKYYAAGEASPQKVIARAAYNFCFGDLELAQRIYDAASKHWFFFSSPVLSNSIEGRWASKVLDRHWKEDYAVSQTQWLGETPRALPISCFVTYAGDTIQDQIEAAKELSELSVLGGGTAVYADIRAISDKAPGPIPYIKVLDGVMGYYRQGLTRRGSTAVYMEVDHPDIIEFIEMKNPSGGDSNRKIDNRMGVHTAVNITNKFVDAVLKDKDWELIDPHTKEVRDTLKARELWHRILDLRVFTGEPYLFFRDVAQKALPQVQKDKGLVIHSSNLCSEITLPTSEDRTAVCCLSSLNLEKFDEWQNTGLVRDLIRFLDNVLQWFIDWAPEPLQKAAKSAKAERALGLGAMGFHYHLMKKGIPFEGGGVGSAVSENYKMFRYIREQADTASRELAFERGEPSDMEDTGRRNSCLMAIAPNANSSVLCATSPAVEPIFSNAYTQKSRVGVTLVRNKFLKQLLQDLGKDSDEVWKSIVDNDGSVQHLSFLSDEQKKVFKTAKEIDQHWIVQHAEDRQLYIDQAQSINLFFPTGSDRGYINSVHLMAMKNKRIKSLYYLRSGAVKAPDVVKEIERKPIKDWLDESVCVSCEG